MPNTFTPACAPPDRRPYFPLPDRLEDARTPIERCVALVGGIGNFASLLQRDTKAVYAWRSRLNGYFPQYMAPRVAKALKNQGYSFPDDFLAQSNSTFVVARGKIVTAVPDKNIPAQGGTQ
ncbi:MAG: hypothetical protein CMF75_08350 [Maricaulis sp.]|nr:hypothetical protein [Maricaulis sp.]